MLRDPYLQTLNWSEGKLKVVCNRPKCTSVWLIAIRGPQGHAARTRDQPKRNPRFLSGRWCRADFQETGTAPMISREKPNGTLAKPRGELGPAPRNFTA